MKKSIICGFSAIISSMWLLAIGAYVQCNPVSEWYKYRFLESAVQLKLIFPLIIGFVMLMLSVVGLGIEYFSQG